MRDLRIGLVGAGGHGTASSRGLMAADGVSIAAVCDVDTKRADAVARELGGAAVVNDYASFLGAGIDLVYVATPPKSHRDLVVQAAAAGKHVLCEKPLAVSRGDVEAMLSAVSSAGVIHAVGHQIRYVGMHRYMRQLVAEGFVGETRLVDIHLPANYATYPTMMPYYSHWSTRRDEAGGLVFEYLNHYVDAIRFVFGDFRVAAAIPHNAVAMRPRLDDATPLRDGLPVEPGPLEPAETEDTVVVVGRLASGGVVSISSSWTLHHPPGNSWHVYGSEGTLQYRDAGYGTPGQLMGARVGESGLRALEAPAELHPDPSSDPAAGYAALHFAFGRDLHAAFNDRSASTCYATFADGLRNHQIMEAMIEGRAEVSTLVPG